MHDCPTCGSPLAGEEIFCLQCGTRLVPEPEPRPSWAVPGAIVVTIALLAVGAVVFALDQVEDDAEREATKPAPVFQEAGRQETAKKPTAVATWPAGGAAYTVQLASADDEASARARASAAVGSGIPAGVLDSEDYPTLDPAGWVLFAGRFDTRAEAGDEAARYTAAGFPEAEPVYVSEQPVPGG